MRAEKAGSVNFITISRRRSATINASPVQDKDHRAGKRAMALKDSCQGLLS